VVPEASCPSGSGTVGNQISPNKQVACQEKPHTGQVSVVLNYLIFLAKPLAWNLKSLLSEMNRVPPPHIPHLENC